MCYFLAEPHTSVEFAASMQTALLKGGQGRVQGDGNLKRCGRPNKGNGNCEAIQQNDAKGRGLET